MQEQQLKGRNTVMKYALTILQVRFSIAIFSTFLCDESFLFAVGAGPMVAVDFCDYLIDKRNYLIKEKKEEDEIDLEIAEIILKGCGFVFSYDDLVLEIVKKLKINLFYLEEYYKNVEREEDRYKDGEEEDRGCDTPVTPL